uniref:CD209 antigen-like protein 2 n=1 Tax=Sinocyclocheilus rhinocerous TaxID=307959 RepID=A0A673HHD7_9TELE
FLCKLNTFENANKHFKDPTSSVKTYRCLVLITVGLGLICVLLLVFIILQHITITNNFNSLSWFFVSTELKSWSDSRQYCRDRGADLVIINTEEKQVSLFISSFVSERVWIGLSDTENEGIMKWVDNSPLKQGFWLKGEPNNYYENEDCIELNYKRDQVEMSPLNSWNDVPCSEKKKGICEK